MALNDVRERGVSISLDKERTLRFDLNAFCLLEEKFGTLQDAFSAMQTGSLRAVRTLLWAGLLHGDEKLTEKKVGVMITMANLPEVMDAIGSAIGEATPDTEARVPEDAPVDPH